MASWTLEHSRILSQLLDQVVGTPEVIDIRQDYCRIYDFLQSTRDQHNIYFTGSKAEGLDLPGSDEDFMFDLNDKLSLKVFQSLDSIPDTSSYSLFLVYTENVSPGFALLQHVNRNTMDPFLDSASQSMYGFLYISSDLFVQNYLAQQQNNMREGYKHERQGPSVECWSKYQDKSGPGDDYVPSIHCPFWPNEAAEWIHRTRCFDWPTSFDIASITEFGFHLVPVGHPHSDMKAMEWRISFSMAERALVWSFNHVQIQCYAIMKILLKEFIKVRCSPQNQVLCSYFIKTFLFWKYETTELNFWRSENLRECIKYILSAFSQCIREGVLRHYFIPSFNLLSVKLTRAAQIELLQLFDIIIESDITFLKECKTLQNIWSEFVKVRENLSNVASNRKRKSIVMNDTCMMMYNERLNIAITDMHQISFNGLLPSSVKIIIRKNLAVLCKTPLKTIMLRKHLFWHIQSLIKNSCGSGNKGVYQLHKTAYNDNLSCDIATCKLWCAILLYMKGDYSSTLNIINKVLSNIPPYAMLWSGAATNISNERKQLYVETFLDSGTTLIQRARKAWLFYLFFLKDIIYSELIPMGLKIELYFSYMCVMLSPFTCAHYLQFLCYHEMHQYDRRDCALRQLTEVANNPEQTCCPVTALNLAGHCMLLAGKRAQARDVFYRSHIFSKGQPLINEYNSALWYLQNYF